MLMKLNLHLKFIYMLKVSKHIFIQCASNSFNDEKGKILLNVLFKNNAVNIKC